MRSRNFPNLVIQGLILLRLNSQSGTGSTSRHRPPGISELGLIGDDERTFRYKVLLVLLAAIVTNEFPCWDTFLWCQLAELVQFPEYNPVPFVIAGILRGRGRTVAEAFRVRSIISLYVADIPTAPGCFMPFGTWIAGGVDVDVDWRTTALDVQFTKDFPGPASKGDFPFCLAYRCGIEQVLNGNWGKESYCGHFGS